MKPQMREEALLRLTEILKEQAERPSLLGNDRDGQEPAPDPSTRAETEPTEPSGTIKSELFA